MEELNARIAAIGKPATTEIIETVSPHEADAYGTVYSLAEVYYVVVGENTVKLTW